METVKRRQRREKERRRVRMKKEEERKGKVITLISHFRCIRERSGDIRRHNTE